MKPLTMSNLHRNSTRPLMLTLWMIYRQLSKMWARTNSNLTISSVWVCRPIKIMDQIVALLKRPSIGIGSQLSKFFNLVGPNSNSPSHTFSKLSKIIRIIPIYHRIKGEKLSAQVSLWSKEEEGEEPPLPVAMEPVVAIMVAASFRLMAVAHNRRSLI